MWATGRWTQDLPPWDSDRSPYEYRDGQWVYLGQSWPRADLQRWLITELGACRASLERFVLRWCLTKHEHEEHDELPRYEPVPDWPYVRALLAALREPRNVVVEKSRAMMVSWLVMLVVLHDLLFRSNWPVMTLSRVEDLVDDGGEGSTEDSLHGKLRLAYEHLPGFLRAVAQLSIRHLMIRNELNGSHVRGFSATPNAGRGPKWRRAILDEFAWVPWTEQVIASVGRACPVGIVLVSTPRGKANAFYRLRSLAVQAWPEREITVRPEDWSRITIHWRQHPERDDQWYERATRDMTPEAVARELDIAYELALSDRVYARFAHEVHVAGGTLCPVRELRYDPSRALYLTCDFNVDPLVWEIAQLYPDRPQYRVIDEISCRNAIIDDAVAEFIARYANRSRAEQMVSVLPQLSDVLPQTDPIPGPAGHGQPVLIYGDATEERASVHSRQRAYERIKQLLAQAGWEVKLCVPPRNPPRLDRIELVNRMLAQQEIVISPVCEELRKDFDGAVWNTAHTDVDQTTPDDDGSGLTRSHASAALGYLLCARRGAKDVARTRQILRGGLISDYVPMPTRLT